MFNTKLVPEIAYHFDKVCRKDLYNGLLTSERDYVSQFNTFLRYPFGPFNISPVVTAITNYSNAEQTFGADGVIIFNLNAGIKIGMFEAKWPRLKIEKKYPWDEINKISKKGYSGYSRFTSQLLRQQKFKKTGIFFWEQFFIEEELGKSTHNSDEYGSTCIWHQDAINHFKTAKSNNHKVKWNNEDLEKMFLNKKKNISEIFNKIINSKSIKNFQIENAAISISDDIKIPILNNDSIVDLEQVNLIKDFMRKNRLKFYLNIKFDE